MEEILAGITAAAGAQYKFIFREGYPAVVNDEACTENIRITAEEIMENENVIILERPMMASEDFAFYQQHFPGAFFFLGSGSPEADSQWSWHHPRYNVDERAFKTGTALMAGIILRSDRN